MNIISNYQMKSLNLNQTTNNQKIQTNPNLTLREFRDKLGIDRE